MWDCLRCVSFSKESICRKSTEKLSIVHRLWQGAFETNGAGFFHSTFWNSVKRGQVEMMQYFAEKPAHIDRFDQIEWSFAHTIAYAIYPRIISDDNVTQQQLDAIKQVFAQNFNDLMQFSHGGNLPIHLACQMNNLLILEIIIEVAKDKFSAKRFAQMLNQVKKDKYWKYSPLMIAIKHNSVDCVELLCKYGSVVDSIFKYKSRYPNYNAFEFACYYNNVDILKILCDHDLNWKQLNSKGYLLRMIKIANYGSTKICSGNSHCGKFLRELSENLDTITKQVKSSTNTPESIFNDINSNDYFQPRCCYNHVLSPTNLFLPEQCDICKERINGCRSCSKCLTKGDSRLFPSTVCAQCAAVTSIWSKLLPAKNELKSKSKNVTELIDINQDIVNRVEFTWLL